jgi:hypothetical protein
MLDFLITGNDIKPLDTIYTECFMCIYATFTLIYYLCGGLTTELDHKIYSFLDWEKPGMTLIVWFLSMLSIAIITFTCILISYARNIIVKKLFDPKVVGNEKDPNDVDGILLKQK